MIGLDVDPVELPRAAARLRTLGFGPDVFTPVQADFRDLRDVLATHAGRPVDGILVDLGVSAMQHDTPSRGFSYKQAGPLDMRLDQTRGVAASERLASLDEPALTDVLRAHADEPHAALIARLLVAHRPTTTQALERTVRLGLAEAVQGLTKAEIKQSIRRTFQALRILVNDEFTALDALLDALPACLAQGGRVVVLTFHSGEDRRVKQAFRRGWRDDVYAEVATRVVRSRKDETFSNRRAASAKLRWAVRR